MFKDYENEMECDQSDGEDLNINDVKISDDHMCWMGDDIEEKMEIDHPEQHMDEKHEDRPMFYPGSLAKKKCMQQKSLSHVPYPKDTYSNLVYSTLQVKPKTINSDVVQMFYR